MNPFFANLVKHFAPRALSATGASASSSTRASARAASAATRTRAPRTVGALSACALAATTVWALSATPAHAQDSFDDANGNSLSLPDIFGPPTNEKKDLPRIELSSQIVLQVLAAEIALQRDQPAAAYQMYLSLARSTHDPRMAQRATEIAVAVQSMGDALHAAQIWRQDAPDSVLAARLNAALLVLSGRPEDAQPLLAGDLARISAERRGDALLSLQRLFADGPNRIGGLSALQALLKNDMDRPEAQVAIGRQQLLTDDPAGAARSFRQALALRADYLPAMQMLSQMGPAERGDSVALLEKYVQRNPKSGEGRLALAQAYVATSQFGDAKKQFEVLNRNANGSDPVSLLALALIDIDQKHYDEAGRYLRQYVKIAEKTPGVDPSRAYFTLAQIAVEQKDDATANDWLNRIPPESSQYVNAQVARAQLLSRQGKVDAARKLLADVNTGDPRDAALIARTDAAILFDAKRYPQAQTRLAQAVNDFPDDDDLIYDYAMAAEKNGHYDLMETQLRRLISLVPDNAQAYNALGYSLADRNLRLDEADKLIEKARALAPDDALIMDSAGWVKYRLGDTSDAIRVLRRAYSLLPNPEIGAHLGEVLWKTGDESGARAAWRAAFKLEPDNDTLLKTLQRFQVQASGL